MIPQVNMLKYKAHWGKKSFIKLEDGSLVVKYVQIVKR
jgi:hypothetical protein